MVSLLVGGYHPHSRPHPPGTPAREPGWWCPENRSRRAAPARATLRLARGLATAGLLPGDRRPRRPAASPFGRRIDQRFCRLPNPTHRVDQVLDPRCHPRDRTSASRAKPMRRGTREVGSGKVHRPVLVPARVHGQRDGEGWSVHGSKAVGTDRCPRPAPDPRWRGVPWHTGVQVARPGADGMSCPWPFP